MATQNVRSKPAISSTVSLSTGCTTHLFLLEHYIDIQSSNDIKDILMKKPRFPMLIPLFLCNYEGGWFEGTRISRNCYIATPVNGEGLQCSSSSWNWGRRLRQCLVMPQLPWHLILHRLGSVAEKWPRKPPWFHVTTTWLSHFTTSLQVGSPSFSRTCSKKGSPPKIQSFPMQTEQWIQNDRNGSNA